MEGAKSPESRPYWIRYLVTFWSGEELKWARDNVLVALLCSLAPGLIVGGIGAALSDQRWRTAAHATLLTYGGLFALFLVWRLVATPLELDRETLRFINALTERLAFATFKLAALQVSPPAVNLEILEIHVQGAYGTLTRHALDVPIDCDIFLWVKLTLCETRPIEVLACELSCVLHGNSLHADYADDIQGWGLVTEKRPVGIGTTFHYTVTRLTTLAHRVEQRGVPVEGWLHFCVNGVHAKEIGATVYRLTVLTPNGGISTDIAGAKNTVGLDGRQFQKLPYASAASRY